MFTHGVFRIACVFDLSATRETWPRFLRVLPFYPTGVFILIALLAAFDIF
jgi:hypothetical protein